MESPTKQIAVESTDIPRERRGKVARHCRQFWWAWVAAFCLFVMVIMLIVVYGILPAVAQKKIDKTVLTLNSLSILDPKPDSLSLSLNSTITGVTGVAKHAHLDPFEVDFFLENHDPIAPFMSLQLPRINGGGSIPVMVTNVTTKIEDVAALTEFSGLLLGSETLRVAIRGRTTLWAGKLHTKVNYNEVVTINGFNQLKGMEITKYTLLDSTKQADGSNLGGQVLIPNPTVVEIQMGNVHIDMALGNSTLGNGTIPSLTVLPGNHTYDFRAKVESRSLISLASALSSGASVSLDVRGTGAEVGGVTIPWLSVPLSQLSVKVPVRKKT